MYIKLCDRCGRVTQNKPAFLIPAPKERASYQCNGEWFGDPVVLCDYCIKDFKNFRINHESYNNNLINDKES